MNEIFKSCLIDLNGVNGNVNLNIIPVGFYDILTGMDWLDMYHTILYFHNLTFTYLNGGGKHKIVEEIPISIFIRDISSLQLIRCLRKGC